MSFSPKKAALKSKGSRADTCNYSNYPYNIYTTKEITTIKRFIFIRFDCSMIVLTEVTQGVV